MIVAYDIPGQLGNQLWAYSNLISIGRSIQTKVMIILQHDYYILLDKSCIHAARKADVLICDGSAWKSKLIRRGILFFTAGNKARMRKLFRALTGIRLVEDPSDYSLAEIKKSKSRIILMNSWNYRTEQNAFLLYADFIRSIISPEEISKHKAEKYIGDLRKKFDCVIAVHIRRGDYANFYGGKYFFDDTVYSEKIKQVRNLFGENKTAFAIFSNEQIDLSNYNGLPVYFNNENTAIGDMWAISRCDYIIGPLSTFSMWASFWNKVPLLFVDKDMVVNSLEQFKPFISQDKQASMIDCDHKKILI